MGKMQSLKDVFILYIFDEYGKINVQAAFGRAKAV